MLERCAVQQMRKERPSRKSLTQQCYNEEEAPEEAQWNKKKQKSADAEEDEGTEVTPLVTMFKNKLAT